MSSTPAAIREWQNVTPDIFYQQDTPRWVGSPFEAMVHAMLAVRSLPERQRAVWHTFFEHYVFLANGDSAEHLPPDRRGIQSPPSAQSAGMMRSYLLERLTREQRLAEPPERGLRPGDAPH